MDKPITDFSGEYAFLSNFYRAPIQVGGFWWPTVEHAFQAAKTDNADEAERIRQASTPGLAKKLGRSVTLTDGWDYAKLRVMTHLLAHKFNQHPYLKHKLSLTGDAKLVEGNTWGDTCWGMTSNDGITWTGDNHLGRLLMELRATL